MDVAECKHAWDEGSAVDFECFHHLSGDGLQDVATAGGAVCGQDKQRPSVPSNMALVKLGTA